MNINDLPLGSNPDALLFEHFPTTFQAVIWRNWGIVPLERIANILGASKKDILAAGIDMGLESPDYADNTWLEKGYLTIIRNNWHLLPYSQLLGLLDWDAAQMDYVLREEDFLWHKLGDLKPSCKTVKYHVLNREEKNKTKRIKQIISKYPNNYINREKPFEFLEKYSQKYPRTTYDKHSVDAHFKLKFIYSYHALYGDSLLELSPDPYPECLLERYSELGINGIWLPGILYSLSPFERAPEYSKGFKKRLANLKTLVKRAEKYGIKVFLYLNEPRGMPLEFFEHYPEWKGTEYKPTGLYAMCTSRLGALEFLSRSLEFVFSRVPGLGGAFCISISENLTHCHSRGQGNKCDLCAKRSEIRIISEVLAAIEKGIHNASPEATVMAHTWAWKAKWTEQLISKLPENIEIITVSEWGKHFKLNGISGEVIDYSISHPGPSEYSRKIWRAALANNIGAGAKVQVNNSWELSAVPYLPVPQLVEKHLNDLRNEKVSTLMLSWTVGGYPSWMLELVHSSTNDIALKYFGKAAAPLIIAAWQKFSDAFREFPFNIGVIYRGPQNFGPVNHFYLKNTGYASTMIGYPYDDLKAWRSIYPEDVFEEQFQFLCEKWEKGITVLKEVRSQIPDNLMANFNDLMTVSQAAFCHFKSTLNLVRFTRRRKSGSAAELISILDDEIELVTKFCKLISEDSRIGFEPSNHYYYTMNDLLEKILSCHHLRSQIH